MVHVSDFMKMERCIRMYQLSRLQKEEFVPFIYYPLDFVQCIKEFFMLDEDHLFEGNRNDPSILAMQAYQEHKHLLNARFEYNGLRIKAPLLLNEDKNILYFTTQSVYPKENMAQQMADTIEVLHILGIEIDEIYLFHVNGEYVRGDSLNIRELFKVSENFYTHHNHIGVNIYEYVQSKRRDILPLIEQLEVLDHSPLQVAVRKQICTRGRKCLYYDRCFKEEEDANSILHLVQSSKKYDMFNDGIKHLRDVDVRRIEGFRQQYAQIMADRNNGIYIDASAIQIWMDDIQYPISYVDFEWETFGYPPYKGMKPLDVLVFQYSLHIEDENHEIIHKGYIGEGDCREAFIQHLLQNIPSKGSIMVYNMEGGEKLRLMQLAKQFPAYTKQIEALCDRMIDLALPFESGNIYLMDMKGSYSLKTLVPLFSDYTYKNMEVSNGIEAVLAWREYIYAENEEKMKLYHQLEDYCAMDTFGEYLVFHGIEKLLAKYNKEA